MFRVDRPDVEVEPTDEAGHQRDRSRYPYWPPRLSTIIAALFVGSSLFFINFVDVQFARSLSHQFGWPFSHHFTGLNQPVSSRDLAVVAVVADLFISALLLASSCATTQVAACLLVGSPRLTVRVLVLGVTTTAMLLAACRWREDYFTYVLYAGFYYSVASLIVLVLSVLLRLELPKVEDPVRRG